MMSKSILKNNLPETIEYIYINSWSALVEQSILFFFYFCEQFCYSHSQPQKMKEKQGITTNFVKILHTTEENSMPISNIVFTT